VALTGLTIDPPAPPPYTPPRVLDASQGGSSASDSRAQSKSRGARFLAPIMRFHDIMAWGVRGGEGIFLLSSRVQGPPSPSLFERFPSVFFVSFVIGIHARSLPWTPTRLPSRPYSLQGSERIGRLGRLLFNSMRLRRMKIQGRTRPHVSHVSHRPADPTATRAPVGVKWEPVGDLGAAFRFAGGVAGSLRFAGLLVVSGADRRQRSNTTLPNKFTTCLLSIS
jgi:hypothetical protein